MRVLVLHTAPPDAPGEGRVPDEFDLSDAASNVASALPEACVCRVGGEVREILALIELHRPGVVFNLCEAPRGRPDLEAHVASLMEWLGVRFTGCSSETLTLCRRKDRAEPVLRQAGIRVPARVDAMRPFFPCIVKPADEDGSAGLDQHSVCEGPDDLARALERLNGSALVQEFLPGREFVVSVWGCCQPDYFSIGETVFRRGLQLITYAAKWHIDSADFADSPLFYDSEITPDLRHQIVQAAKGAWQAVGARHAIRVDIRLDLAGNAHVLDVNPNPEMSPGVGICRGVQEAGWDWRDFVRKLVEWA